MYAYPVFIIITILNKRYKTQNKYRVIRIPSVLAVFSLRSFTREVTVVK